MIAGKSADPWPLANHHGPSDAVPGASPALPCGYGQPHGYAARVSDAEARMCRGERQVYCMDCGLWRWPDQVAQGHVTRTATEWARDLEAIEKAERKRRGRVTLATAQARAAEDAADRSSPEYRAMALSVSAVTLDQLRKESTPVLDIKDAVR